MYTDVVDESVPDDFLSFLHEADVRQADSAAGTTKNVDPTDPSPKGDATQPER